MLFNDLLDLCPATLSPSSDTGGEDSCLIYHWLGPRLCKARCSLVDDWQIIGDFFLVEMQIIWWKNNHIGYVFMALQGIN